VREHEVYAVARAPGSALGRRAAAQQSRAPPTRRTNIDLFSPRIHPSSSTASRARAAKKAAQRRPRSSRPSKPDRVRSSQGGGEERWSRLAKGGAEVISHITQVADSGWLVTNPKVNVAACKVEWQADADHHGPTREAVDEKVRDLVHSSAGAGQRYRAQRWRLGLRLRHRGTQPQAA